MTSDVIIMGGQSPALPRGRLMFALDATASREPTWAIARDLQARMFRAAAPVGRLDMKLIYYRGEGECKKSEWVSSGEQLAQLMNKIDCDGGLTQIARVLQHAISEAEKAPVQALTFIGDAMEESLDELASLAAQLGRLNVPIFPPWRAGQSLPSTQAAIVSNCRIPCCSMSHGAAVSNCKSLKRNRNICNMLRQGRAPTMKLSY